MSGPRRGVVLTLGVLLGLAALTACGSDATGDDDAASGASDAAAGCALSVSDQWVKATDEDMTAVFGTISNPGTSAVTVVAVSSPQAGMAEIHEVVTTDGSSVMQPKEGGLQIAAGASASLAPGADHLMLMDLTGPIQAGDEVEVTLQCADGATTEFLAVAKPFEGGGESYAPDQDDMEMSPSANG